MKRFVVHPKAIKAADDIEQSNPKVGEVCKKLLDLVKDGIITDDEYDDIREILHRYQSR